MLIADQQAQSVHTLIKSLTLDPNGFVHTADDGIVRSYAANGTVIDYQALTNCQLRAQMNSLPPSMDRYLDHLHEVFAVVDGTTVEDGKQIWNPPQHLRPLTNSRIHEDVAGASDAKEDSAFSSPVGGVPLPAPPNPGLPFCWGQPCLSSGSCQFVS